MGKILTLHEVSYRFELRGLGTSSVFAGTGVEVTEKPFLGKKEHITMTTDEDRKRILSVNVDGIFSGIKESVEEVRIEKGTVAGG